MLLPQQSGPSIDHRDKTFSMYWTLSCISFGRAGFNSVFDLPSVEDNKKKLKITLENSNTHTKPNTKHNQKSTHPATFNAIAFQLVSYHISDEF